MDEFFGDVLENLDVRKANPAKSKVELEDIEAYIKETGKFPDYGQGKLVNSRVDQS